MKKQFLYIIIFVLSSAPILAMDQIRHNNSRCQSRNSEEEISFDSPHNREEDFGNMYSGGMPREQNQIKLTKIDGTSYGPASILYLPASFKLDRLSQESEEHQIGRASTHVDFNKGHLVSFSFKHKKFKKNSYTLERTIVGLCDKETVIGKLFFGIKNNPSITRFGTIAMMVGGSCIGLGTLSVPWALLALSGAFFKLSSDQYLTVEDRYTEIRNSLIFGAILGCGLFASKNLHMK